MIRQEEFGNGGCVHSKFNAALKTCKHRRNGEKACRDGF